MGSNQSDDKARSGRLDVPLRPNGKPVRYISDYDPRFCNKVVALGQRGATYAQMCAALDISKRKSESWRKIYEEWDESLHLALTASEASSDSKGFDNLNQKDFRDTVWKELRHDYKPIEKEEKPESSIDDPKFTEIKNKYMKEEI